MPRVSKDKTTPWAHDWTSLVKGKRGTVAGRSGSGKSNGTKYIVKAVDRSLLVVYMSAHRKDRIRGVKRVNSVDELVALAKTGVRKIQLILPKIDSDGVDAINERLSSLWRWVEATGENLAPGDSTAPPWILVVFDEAHRYAPLNGPYGPVETFLCEGRKFGSSVIVISQRPQQVTGEAWEQADWTILYRCKLAGAKYLAQKGIPYKEFQEHVEQEYHYVMVDDDKWTPYGALPEVA